MSARKSTSLTSSLEFERVYRDGSICRGRFFSIHVLRNGVGGARLGLSVPKRVGSAVCRNKVRRRLREIFRSVAPGLREGVDVVVSARPAAADASFEEMESEFRRALGRMKGIGGAENGGEGR